MSYIYALVDPRTNEIRYVGKSDNPEKRLSYGHMKCIGRNKYKNNWIKQLLKLNLQPSLMILEECENEESVWSAREKYWIKYYREQGCDLTNLTDGGENPPSQTGKKQSIITRKKISIALSGENNPNYGKHLSPERKIIQSMNNKGENNPNYGKIGKLSPNYGLKRSKEACEKMRKIALERYAMMREKGEIFVSPMKGKTQSDKNRLAVAEANRKRKHKK